MHNLADVSRNGALCDAQPDCILETTARTKVARYRTGYAEIKYAFLKVVFRDHIPPEVGGAKTGYVRSTLHTPTVLMTLQRRLLGHGNFDLPVIEISARSSALLCRPGQEDIEYKTSHRTSRRMLACFANRGLGVTHDEGRRGAQGAAA